MRQRVEFAEPHAAAEGEARHLTVRLGQVFPILLDALSHGRTWLNDFDDEPIQISEDLYDVLLAYRHFHES